jgi:hypothetical protein
MTTLYSCDVFASMHLQFDCATGWIGIVDNEIELTRMPVKTRLDLEC